MKKTVYYISPLIFLPILFGISTLLEGMEPLEPFVMYIIFAALFLFSVVIGILSPAKTKFDYIITVIVPLAVLASLFVMLFFDEGCNGKPQLSLSHALNIEYYYPWFVIAAIMMAIVFVCSFKPIRNVVKNIFVRKTQE